MSGAVHASEPKLVDRAGVRVLFRRVPDELRAIRQAMAEVEAAVGLRGRRYLGAFDLDGAEYRVCVVVRDGDDATALGLETGALPGGRSLRVRLTGEPPELYGAIGVEFAQLQARPERDPGRPGIELYRGATRSTCCCRSAD